MNLKMLIIKYVCFKNKEEIAYLLKIFNKNNNCKIKETITFVL